MFDLVRGPSKLNLWLPRLLIGLLLTASLLSLSQPETGALSISASTRDYRAMLEFYPRDRTVWPHWIADAANHDPALALNLLTRYAQMDSTAWTAAQRREYADLLASQGDSNGAYQMRRALLTDWPQEIGLWQAVSAADLLRHNWPEAIADLSHLVALTPNDGQALYTLGLLLSPDQADQAARVFGQAINIADYHDRALRASQALSRLTHGSALTAMGFDLAATGDWALADYLLGRASALDSGNMATLAMYGAAEEQQGRLVQGWALIQQAAILAPTDPVVNYALSAHWQRLGDWPTALAALNAAEARDPNNPALAEQIGLVYQQQGATDPAAHWLILAVKLAPTNVDFAEALAMLYADQRYVLDSGGLTFIQLAVKQFPNSASLHASLGAALLATGQINAAIPDLWHAVGLNPNSARANYYLAQALEKSGDLNGAAQAYLTASKTNPANGEGTESAFRQLAERAATRLGLSGG